MDGVGNLAGWRWIFILEGIATVLIGAIAAVFLPADISSAKFLTDEEKEFARTFALSDWRRHWSCSLVKRFWSSNAIVTRKPLSDASLSITTSEKGVTHHVEVATDKRQSPSTVYVDDEQFEWYEVLRGKYSTIEIFLLRHHSNLSSSKDALIHKYGWLDSGTSDSSWASTRSPYSCRSSRLLLVSPLTLCPQDPL